MEEVSIEVSISDAARAMGRSRSVAKVLAVQQNLHKARASRRAVSPCNCGNEDGAVWSTHKSTCPVWTRGYQAERRRRA